MIAGCFTNSEIINSSNVISITVTASQPTQSQIEITDSNRIKDILRKFNNARQEPIKFYPTHRVSVTYAGGDTVLLLFSDHSMKVRGHTYKLKQEITEILRH
jgi:hypothetical protein